MIGIVIVANRNLAVELHKCVVSILGRQDDFVSIAVEDEHDRLSKQQEICDALCAVDCGDGIAVVTDVYGSSPANLSMCVCSRDDAVVLTGANLPMLLKLVKSRRKSLEEATRLACEAGRQHIRMFD